MAKWFAARPARLSRNDDRDEIEAVTKDCNEHNEFLNIWVSPAQFAGVARI